MRTTPYTTSRPLTLDDEDLFVALATRNFEEVLNHLRTARLICEQAGHNADEVQDRYDSIREALLTAVHDHHITWHEVNAGAQLLKIREAFLTYDAVFTTSYDLLIYWAMMSAGVPPGDGFGDLFWNAGHTFDPFDTEAFGHKTLVYWLHGGLHLYRSLSGETKKRTNTGASLLTTFAAGGRIPLFVSEGTSTQKRCAIRRSDYLEHVYRTFADTEDDLVVFGQAFGQPDNHLVWSGRHLTETSPAASAKGKQPRPGLRSPSARTGLRHSPRHPYLEGPQYEPQRRCTGVGLRTGPRSCHCCWW